MKFRYWRITVLAVVMVLMAPLAAIAADQTVDVEVLPADTLSIDVQGELGLGAVVPGDMTAESDFEIWITNTTSGGWAVTVEAGDFKSFTYDNCDEYGCDRVDTDPLFTMGAQYIYMNGGEQPWGDPNQLTFHEGYLAGPATPFALVEGTSDVYGSLGIHDRRPSIKVNVPGGQELASYWTTLTYTIMGA
jgi:hypothetical protein